MLSEGNSDSAESIFNLDTTSEDDQGKFVIDFDASAVDETAYIALSGASSTANSFPAIAGAYVYIESTSNDNVALQTGIVNVALERVSGGTLDGNYVRINEGQTAQLRATGYYNPTATGTYRAQLYAINFNDMKAPGDTQQLALPTSDFQSPSVQILN